MTIAITQFADKCETLIVLTNSCSNSIVVDWSLAPDWANWWAMDYEGKCFWYEQKPSLSERVAIPRVFFRTAPDRVIMDVLVFPHESFFPHWRDTLCARPAPESFVISYGGNTLCFTDPLEFKRAVTWLNTREIKYTIS